MRHGTARGVALATALGLTWAPAAFGHGAGPEGFRATVTAIRPALAGVEVTVLGGDHELRLANRSGKEILIRGYDGEPYLRFSADGVYRNRRAATYWLNLDRYAKVAVPAEADSKADPKWEKVTTGDTYAWHDHRAHWMSPIPPPKVKRAPDRTHFVFNWRVPGESAGRPIAIAGRLDYVPVADAGNWGPVLRARRRHCSGGRDGAPVPVPAQEAAPESLGSVFASER